LKCIKLRFSLLLCIRLTFCRYFVWYIYYQRVAAKRSWRVFNEMLLRRRIFLLPQILLRGKLPPIFFRCCYRLAFLSVVGYNHFYVCLCHLLSAFLSGLGVGCFIFFDVLVKIFCYLGWLGGSSFAIFGLCVGLCELQMCLHLCSFNNYFILISIIVSSPAILRTFILKGFLL